MEANETITEEEGKLFRSLTNIDGLSSRISKTLQQEYPNIKIATKTAGTVNTLLPLVKDKTAKAQQSSATIKRDLQDLLRRL